VHTLDDLDAALESLVALRAPAAAAVKSCALYTRRLDVMGDDPEAAARALRAVRRHRVAEVEQRRALEDHVLHRAFALAAEHGLRVKLHTGMCAGLGNGRIGPAMDAAADVEPILQAHRDTTFVLMHAGWPATDEVIALAKSHPNVHVDLCWAWIVNPVATERFVVEYLAAAPASKLLGFGGDYPIPETITGHLSLARGGLCRALLRAVELGVARAEDVPGLARMILRDNALAVTSPLQAQPPAVDSGAALGA
jgi:predicted TIM-barrel fold metal-dependent hydrolase